MTSFFKQTIGADGMPEIGFIGVGDLCRTLCISRSTVIRGIEAGVFPQPDLMLGPRRLFNVITVRALLQKLKGGRFTLRVPVTVRSRAKAVAKPAATRARRRKKQRQSERASA